jgi:hypothetical protein
MTWSDGCPWDAEDEEEEMQHAHVWLFSCFEVGKKKDRTLLFDSTTMDEPIPPCDILGRMDSDPPMIVMRSQPRAASILD